MANTLKHGKNMHSRKSYIPKGSSIRSQTGSSKSLRNKSKPHLKLQNNHIERHTYKRICHKGTILRKSYIRYSKKGARIFVKEGCIRDIGAPGKGFRDGPGIGPLRKGDLSKHGYSRVASMSKEVRYSALKKAIEEYGSLTVWRKLNAVYIYTRRASPSNSRIFKEDMDWIRSVYGIKAL